MDWVEYEQRVARVVSKLRRQVPGLESDAVRSGRDSRIPGASGYRHQIDVSVSTPQCLLLVECKRWRRKVGLNAVLAFYARLVDIEKAMGNHNRNIVAAIATASGFTRGALQLAEHFAVERWHVHNEDEFVCRIMDVIGLGLGDAAGFGTKVQTQVLRGGDSQGTQDR